jgi:mannose-6-phosphate isomerase-like protein (cupin superfamily)
MKLINTSGKRGFFQVLHASRAAQAAMSTLRSGKATSDEPENEHPDSEQWVYVVAGSGLAVVGKRRAKLAAGSLLLIEKGEKHQIRQAGRGELVLVNLYVPPAYTKSGEVR